MNWKRRWKRNWWLYLLFAVAVVLVAIFGVGCGHGQRMMDSPIGPELGQPTRATKPVVQDISFLGNRQATINVVRVIAETGQQAFGGPDYFIQFSRAISGKKVTWDWAGNFNTEGKATIKIVSGQNVSGYYRARLIFFRVGGQQEANTFGVLAEWTSIPINGGQTVNLVLSYGQQARVILDEVQPERGKLTITSPAKGEVWKIGRLEPVKWADSFGISVDKYVVTLINKAGNHEWGITDGQYVPARESTGFYTWVVGSLPGMFGSAEPPPPGGYYMEVSGYKNDQLSAVVTTRSEIFWIDPPGAEDPLVLNLVIQIRSLQRGWDDLFSSSKGDGTLDSKEVQDRLAMLSLQRRVAEVQLNTILLSRISRG